MTTRLRQGRLAVTMRGPRAVARRGTVVMPKSVKRELIWLGVALFAGLVVFPLLVYATGMLTLGPYSRGGAGRFLVDFLRSLVRLEWQALTLAAPPIALIRRVAGHSGAARPVVGRRIRRPGGRSRRCRAPRAHALAGPLYCEAAPPARLWSRMARNSLPGRQFGKPRSIASIRPTSK